MPPPVILMVKSCTTMKIHTSSLDSKIILPCVSFCPVEGFIPVTILHVLIEVEIENEVNFLIDVEVDWIGVGGNSEVV